MIKLILINIYGFEEYTSKHIHVKNNLTFLRHAQSNYNV